MPLSSPPRQFFHEVPWSWLNNLRNFAQVGCVRITQATTLDNSYSVVIGIATSAAFTVTLPPSADYVGKWFTIKKGDSSVNAVTVDGDGSETIDGATTNVLSSQYDSITVVSDGITWWIV